MWKNEISILSLIQETGLNVLFTLTLKGETLLAWSVKAQAFSHERIRLLEVFVKRVTHKN